jgi:hypothetical protein
MTASEGIACTAGPPAHGHTETKNRQEAGIGHKVNIHTYTVATRKMVQDELFTAGRRGGGGVTGASLRVE